MHCVREVYMTIEEKILNCVESCGINILDYEKNENLLEQIEFTSLEFITLIVKLEDEFNIEFPSELLNISIVSSFDYLVKIVNELYKVQNQNNEEKNEG